ncbi:MULTISPECIES: hypothetical protein [unclassified Microcystis]|jgi:hypothetical protein|uniref:hypothetical protein n=1 Tax=unclassified Microcystis TaxID=2643300 RepID=UPI0022C39C81|nr:MULTISPECIES: hypothetical protein [unclassified Microcystis]MCZ8047965.1 hypothetical protein [Microcystis sp. LE19-41.2A]MCZ8288780.1 hypothetical protein [Microcystis sp. LE19-59.1C]
MTNRLEVESAIKQLPESEVRSLANWLQDYLDEMWDRQIEADLASGKLDRLSAQAEEDIATNNVRDLDLPLIMDEPIDIEVVRTEALRKLGRNIVNFSKIEGTLKYLLSVTQSEGLSTSTCNQLVDNYERFRKHTLGRLVWKLHDTVLVDDSQSKPQLFKVSYSDSDCLNAQKQALLDIVAERNKLIHQDLAPLGTSSIEDYYKLISLLDEQNPRLLAHLEELGWMLTSCIELVKDLQSFIKSPDFHQFIHSSQSDA